MPLIEVKYNIGDKVRFKHAAIFEDKSNCSFCNGSGKVTSMFDGTEEECPRCEGTGYIVIERKGMKEDVDTIKQIQVCCYGDRRKPYVLYQMSGWKYSQSWFAEDQILGVIE